MGMNRDNVETGPWKQSTSIDRFEVFSVGEWQGRDKPRREWVVDGLIPVGQVVMLSGDGGVGKSLLAQQLLTAAALGDKWLGFRPKRMRTLGLFCEDSKLELEIRQNEINEYYDCDMADLGEDFFLQSRVSMTSYMASFEKWTDEIKPTALWDQLCYKVADLGIQILVLDTVRKCFGGNEISERQVSQYVTMLRKLAVQMQGAVIITAHPSNEGVATGSGIAGSRAWHNDVRSRIYLTNPKARGEKEPDPLARVMRVMKSNYGPPGGKVDLRYRNGVFVLNTDEPLAEVRDFSEPSLLE